MKFRRPRSLRRAALTLAIVALVSLTARALWANGVFSTVNTGFSGSCKPLAALPVADMESALGTVFLSVSDPRGPSAADGIYALPPDAKTPIRLAGTPKDFHPRGIGLSVTADGKGLFLFVVNRRSTGRLSVDSFEVANPAGQPALIAQGTVEGGLLTNPQDVAATGPTSFYVANGTASRFAPLHWLQQQGVFPGGEVLYFNGMSFKSVVDGFYGTRSLILTPDNHLIVSGLLSRSLTTFTREPFSGALTEAGTRLVGAGAEMLSRDAVGQVLVAGHAQPHGASSQIFRLDMASGVPQEPHPVYSNDGSEISAASVAVMQGNSLLIGSAVGGKLLSCSP